MELDNVINYRWSSGTRTIGMVAYKTTGGWKAVIGIAKGIDEQEDVNNIADWGAKMSKFEATTFFPEFKADEFVGH